MTFLLSSTVNGQVILGADLSYVNEMEDCGVVYEEDGNPKDPYKIFADHDCDLVRLRLWHTPSWYDDLNDGKRYSDLSDVKRSIARAREEGMKVLLDFHLSDNWADPSKQVVPAAWSDVVDNLPVLKDSLYNYIYSTLHHLNDEELLPEMIQIGNETNKGILQSQEDNDSGWKLDWDRNSQLFNAAIEAVNDFESESGKDIRTVIHAADPDNAEWIFDEFIENGVTDFDVMGISYYWAWHMPTSIGETGEIVAQLKEDHPNYDVMIVETGYIWTWESNDQAGNIIGEVHPDYSPPSPENQRDWLIDMTQEVIDNGALGVIYWEPAWVSSDCWTQWGKGSHQEHATFFDFDNNLIENGGIQWLGYDYGSTSTVNPSNQAAPSIVIYADSNSNILVIEFGDVTNIDDPGLQLVSTDGRVIFSRPLPPVVSRNERYTLDLPALAESVYFVSLHDGERLLKTARVFTGGR